MRKLISQPFILSLALISLLIFLNQLGWLSFISENIFKLSAPGQRLVYNLSLKSNAALNFILSINNLEKENEKLKEDREELLGQISQLKNVFDENSFLRKHLGIEAEEDRKLVLADVIGGDSSGIGKYILINKGEKDGIDLKSAVILSDNFLIGQVIETGDSFSKVRLITDNNSRINVVLRDLKAQGILEMENGNLVVKFIPQGENIEKGQMVFTSGLAEVFPSGILIGRISGVISSDASISQKAEIELAADFKYLNRVFVILKK